jgi:hypothetical protein
MGEWLMRGGLLGQSAEERRSNFLIEHVLVYERYIEEYSEDTKEATATLANHLSEMKKTVPKYPQRTPGATHCNI